MKTWSQMLQSRPITAPGRTWAKAQTRVPAPTRLLSRSPWGWTKTLSGFWSSNLELLPRKHDVVRPPLRILEGSPQIPAEDAESQAVEPPEEHDQGGGRRVTGYGNREEEL